MAVALPSAPHLQDSALLTKRQKKKRSEKDIVKRGFGGIITIDSDPCEANRHAHLECLNASHWGDKDSCMVIWAKAHTHPAGVCLGIVRQTSSDPDQWIWSAYRVMREIDNQMAEILAVAMALKIAKDECDKLA